MVSSNEEISKLEEVLFSLLRKNSGNNLLDIQLDAIDQTSEMELYRISNNPNISENLKRFCSWMQGIEHNFSVALTYVNFNHINSAKNTVREAENSYRNGREKCGKYFSGCSLELLSWMDDYYQRCLSAATKRINESVQQMPNTDSLLN